jgi:ribosome-associated heat shock protein Hsp15
MAEHSDGGMRIDKWLWAARFFKTRTTAAQAVEGGRVQVNGKRVKAALQLKRGDQLEIAIGDVRWTIAVRALNMQRRPAAEARLLYEETEASRAARQAHLDQKKLAAEPSAHIKGRPTKRDRRHLQRIVS